MIKKIFKVALVIIIMYISGPSNVYAVTSEFDFVINTIGVPKYNVYSEEINETVYKSYNIFSYGLPQNLEYISSQRFKNVSNGLYYRNGVRGEYRYLGRNYNGELIDNPYFPVDSRTYTTPNTWNYIAYSSALESWNISNFSNNNQREYMKNTYMLFDYIDSKTGITNPYIQMSYGITPNSVGLDKVVVSTPSTWKTSGSLIARFTRSDIAGVRYAIFSTAPMASNSNVVSKLATKEEYFLESSEDEISIAIDYSAVVTNLTGYATTEDIKNITSELYIGDKKVDYVSNEKTDRVKDTYIYKVSRNEYTQGKYPINITVNSYLYTKFCVDGLLQDKITKTIYINVKEKADENIEVSEVLKLEKNSEAKYVVKELIKTDITNAWDNSFGVIQKGEHLAIKIKNVQDTSKLKIYAKDVLQDISEIYNKNNITIITFEIPNYISDTIATWSYLREKTKNYFNINLNEVGKRIDSPIKIAIYYNETNVAEYSIDIASNYNLNYNYILENVTNLESINNYLTIEKWANKNE